MTKRKLVQLGVTGVMVAVLAVGGLWAHKNGKFFSKADTIAVSPMNLTATIPGVADDPINYYSWNWSYKYIDAVTKAGSSPTEGQIIGFYSDNTFRPAIAMDKASYAVHAARALGIRPFCSFNKDGTLNPASPVNCVMWDRHLDFADVASNYWALPWIEAVYRAGLFRCRTISGLSAPYCFNIYNGYFLPTEPMPGYALTTLLWNAGKSHNYPPGASFADYSYPVTRGMFAAVFAYNLNLPGDNPAPEVFLQWDFPTDANAGFDWGYEVWRQKTGEAEPTLLYVQEPPEQGMEEGSDFGMFYDTSIVANATYTYTIKIFNRDGDYGNPASVSINMPAMP